MKKTPRLLEKFTDGARVYEVVGIYFGDAVVLQDQHGKKITTGVEGRTFQCLTPCVYEKETP
jgi:hypothetical protein